MWLDKQIKNQTAERTSTTQLGSVVNLPIALPADPPSFASEEAQAALDLVSELAESIKSAEDRAAEMMARAQGLANNAVEKVRLTEARIVRAEAAKREIEDGLAEARAEVEN